jgi:hypothetical protein
MQPETALFLLSALAQASAALAGLSALVWAFILRTTREDWKDLEETGGPAGGFIKGLPLAIKMSGATVGYLLAVFISLVTLAFVERGPEPVHVAIPISAFVAMGIAVIASVFLVLFLTDPWSSFMGLVTDEDPKKKD